MTTPPTPSGLRIGFVPGITLTKWTTIWRERFGSIGLQVVEVAEARQRQALDDDEVDLLFVRLPIETDGLHLIPLYEEEPVVLVSKEHPISAFEEVTLADLADETVLTTADPTSINQVALEVAVLRVPMSIARSHSRRDLTYRRLTDAPRTTIGLAWLTAEPHPLTEEFIGVVRGRTPNSARTRNERASKQQPPAPKARSQDKRAAKRPKPRRR